MEDKNFNQESIKILYNESLHEHNRCMQIKYEMENKAGIILGFTTLFILYLINNNKLSNIDFKALYVLITLEHLFYILSIIFALVAIVSLILLLKSRPYITIPLDNVKESRFYIKSDELKETSQMIKDIFEMYKDQINNYDNKLKKINKCYKISLVTLLMSIIFIVMSHLIKYMEGVLK